MSKQIDDENELDLLHYAATNLCNARATTIKVTQTTTLK